jgi:transposase-like protein
MRIQRITTEWGTIIAEQKESGATITAFCRENGIHPNVFYRKQKELRQGEQAFIRVQSVSGTGEAGSIRIGDIEIEVREGVTNEFLARMIRCVIEAKNLSFPNNTPVFIRTGATDMRKPINGLSAIVQNEMKQNPFQSGYFDFCNKGKSPNFLLQYSFLFLSRKEIFNRFTYPITGRFCVFSGPSAFSAVS